MPTSGVTSYKLIARKYFESALRKSKVISRFDEPEAEDLIDAMESANNFLATISERSDRYPNQKAWLKKSGALLLGRNQFEFRLGGDNSDLAVKLDDLVIGDIRNQSDLTQGQNTLDAKITEDFTVNHRVAVHYNDRGFWDSAITSYASDDNAVSTSLSVGGGWLFGSNWVETSDDGLSSDGTQTDDTDLRQLSVLTVDTRYAVFVNISDFSQGTLTVRSGNVTGSVINANGWHVSYITAESTTFTLRADEFFEGQVDDIVVMPITSDLSLTLETHLNRPATQANEAFFYTTKIDKPLKLITMSRRDRDGGDDQNDSPMVRWTEKQYQALGDKDERGDPVAYYYEEKLTDGILRLDTVNTNIRDILVFKYISSIQYFTDFEDELDVPDIGREYFIYSLAKRLAAEHGKAWTPENESILREAEFRFMNSEPEDLVMFFEPDRTEFGDAFGGEFE